MEQTPSGKQGARTARVIKAREPVQPIRRVQQPTRQAQPQYEGNYYEPPYREDNWGRDWEAEQMPPVRPNKKKGHPVLCGVIIFVCCVLLASLVILMSPQLLGVYWQDMPNIGFVSGDIMIYDPEITASYRQMRQYMAEDTIFPGVYVDGIHVGGMTVEEARQELDKQATQTMGGFTVTVNVGNKSWTIDSTQVPLKRNTERILAQAYACGRQNDLADTLAAKQTPLQSRYNAALKLRQSPVSLHTEMTYDQAKVRELTDSIAAYVNREAQDATVASFNFVSRTFTFTDESYGVYVDADELYRQVTAKLDARAYGSVLVFEPVVVTPRHTKVELMNNYKLLSSYTTETTSNKNRNTNIDLSAQAINGTTVMPGETFSFNAATGQRTAEKGYKPAAAIAGGQSFDEIGGGVCQTSGTLFNAVARADLEIVYRSPHAWPSTYVEKGMDATVNWPNLDFKFKNNKDTPIFIVSYYSDRKVTCEVYGLSLGSGVSIDLESAVIRTISPPSGINYVLNESLEPGTSKETVKARTGYVVETYKIWYQNGQEVSRELLCTSNYKAYQRTIEYN